MSEQVKKTEGDENLVTLSTGVVLRAKQANPLLLIKVMAQDPQPKPPLVTVPQMGNKEVENYEDPNYIERLENWKSRYSERLLNVMLGEGTEVVSVPKGVPKLDEDSWVEKLRIYDVDVTNKGNKDWRYINWVTTVACGDEKDLKKIQTLVQKLSGVSEEDVEQATSFPGSDEKSG